MANYDCVIRTNYFHVKDENKFREFMSQVYGDDEIHLWTKEDKVGNTVFAFGCYGGISGRKLETFDESFEDAYNAFAKGLQECVAEDDAIVIMEVGNEKLRYLVGTATIITHDAYNYVSLEEEVFFRTCEILKNDNWEMQINY